LAENSLFCAAGICVFLCFNQCQTSVSSTWPRRPQGKKINVRFIRFLFVTIAISLVGSGCDMNFEGAQPTGGFAFSELRTVEGMTFQFRLHHVKYDGDNMRIFVWCSSDATRSMKSSEQVAEYRRMPIFAETGWLLAGGLHVVGPISKSDLTQIIDSQLAVVDKKTVFIDTIHPALVRDSCARKGKHISFMGVLQEAFLAGEIRNPSQQREWWKLPPFYSKFTQEKTSNALCFEVNQHYVVATSKGYCVCSRDDGKSWESHVRAPSEACK
jgi:hypothetical protein